MAGARALWRANGMAEEQIGRPIIAIVNSFTQFVPGHTHLHEIGQTVKREIEKLGCFAAEFNTIAIDDGIAMGHDGMLYSLPSRDLIADSVEYMVNAHKADAMVCISNCDKVTPGMLMAAMRLNIPAIFVSGGPMEAGRMGDRPLDLIDIMIDSADPTVSDSDVAELERRGCPTCGSCSGMFTANSMNSLNEAIGLALPGNGTVVATHINRRELFREAARRIVENTYRYYRDGDTSVLPRSIATRQAMLNARRVILEVAARFRAMTGREYGFFEAYRLEDAEYAVVIIGSAAGTCKAAVEQIRNTTGKKVGLLKIRVFRPFPEEEIAAALTHVKAVAILDRSEMFSATGGPLGAEVRAALYQAKCNAEAVNYIYGLGGRDITVEDFCRVYEKLERIAAEHRVTDMYDYIGLRSR